MPVGDQFANVESGHDKLPFTTRANNETVSDANENDLSN